VRVPDDEPFVKAVSDCVRLDLGKGQCPSDRLVGLGGVIEKALEIVMEGLSRETSLVDRKPPLAITRLARGGKTTALCLLFDAIKDIKLEGGMVNAILISFNGFGAFASKKDEPQTNAIIRNIVLQLVGPSIDQKKIVCTREALDAHIGDDPFVLLIDELNQLANPLDREAAQLLQDLFLKKKNRYLVFTSHYRMNIDPKAEGEKVSESDPGVKYIALPVSTDLASLRLMPGCASINPATVALYGGIPSLIYAVFALDNKTPQDRFVDAGLKILEADQEEMLNLFVKAVVEGTRNHELKKFEQFAITTTDGKIQWPICYIRCILGLFVQTSITRFILDECLNLATLALITGTGLDWENIINIALGFRCLHQVYCGDKSPFDIVPRDVKPKVIAIRLPDDIESIQKAKDYMLSTVNETADYPALVLAKPTFSGFPIVDGLVAFHSTPTEEIKIYGYQAKLGSGSPKNFGKYLGLKRGILLQGQAPQAAGAANEDSLLAMDDAEPEAPKKRSGWEHWTKIQVQDLLGYSLKDLYPADWSSFDSSTPPGGGAAAAEADQQNKKMKLSKSLA